LYVGHGVAIIFGGPLAAIVVADQVIVLDGLPEQVEPHLVASASARTWNEARSLAGELAPARIGVNRIAPGPVDALLDET
jgi:hypothetical protein